MKRRAYWRTCEECGKRDYCKEDVEGLMICHDCSGEPKKEYCLRSQFGDFADVIKAKYGVKRGETSCPDCGRTIRIRQGNGAAYSIVPRHLKPQARA